jgi:hypothetical protein
MLPFLFYLFLFLTFGLVALALWQMAKGEDLSRPF